MTAMPFVKWAGGKRQILHELLERVPPRFERYFEPFVGAGALFFELEYEPSILVDSNADLINCYRVIRDDVENLLQLLAEHKSRHSEEYYYRVRGLSTRKTKKLGIDDELLPVDNLSETERAARFIYLNRTCYNGLYRLNSRGQFNVPFGRHKNPRIHDADNLREVSRVLQRARIHQADFTVIRETYAISSGDFIYFDPPYMPLSKTSDFTSYTCGGFTAEDQLRLCRLFRELDGRGARCMLSNSDTAFIREHYRDFSIHRIEARRAINRDAGQRGGVSELIITNY